MTIPLNPAQDAAVRHPAGPLLVLAGAGSGKTRVLTARIAHLIKERGVRADRIFAVTFTNKAAGEMRARVAALLGADPRGLWIGTFHALSARLLRREAPLLGFGSNFTIYDQDDSEALVKRPLEQRNLSPKAHPPRAVHALISAAKNRMLEPEEFAAAAEGALARAAAEVYAALRPALKQANAMDFDDLLLFPLELLPAHPERLAYCQPGLPPPPSTPPPARRPGGGGPAKPRAGQAQGAEAPGSWLLVTGRRPPREPAPVGGPWP